MKVRPLPDLVSALIVLCFIVRQAVPFRMGDGGGAMTARIPSYRNKQFLRSTTVDTQPPMKVLLLVEPTPFNYVSGYANRFQEMLRYLKLAGDKVRVVTPDSDSNPPKSFLGFPITTPRGFQLPMYKKVTLTLDFLGNIPKLIRSFKPNVVHVSSPSCIVVPAIFWSRWLDVPLVMSYHTDLSQYAKIYLPFLPKLVTAMCHWVIERTHACADLTLTTSPQLKEELQKIGVRRVDIWQKGINTEVFNPKFRDLDTRRQLSNNHPESPLLLYVGRLGEEKRIDRLKEVLLAHPASRLVIVGTGPAEEQLRETFAGLPVHFAGQLSGVELSRAFASCDIFVMPSDTETLGFVVLEALASGLPVVAVRAGGLPDIIQHEVTGYLVRNDDHMREFTDRVGHLLRCAGARRHLGTTAENWSKQWSWRAATEKLRNIQYPLAMHLHAARDVHGWHDADAERAILNKN